MRPGQICLIGVATALALTAFKTLPTWAAPPRSYRVGDEQYDCRNRGPYNNSIRDLQDARNRLDREIRELPQRIIEADRKVRATRAKYDQTFTTPSSYRAERESLEDDYREALAEREGLKRELKEKERQKANLENQMARAGEDFRRACDECEPYRTAQGDWEFPCGRGQPR